MSGRLIGVVGPSGVGKDSLIAALVARRPELGRVRRVITRPAGLGGEDYDPVSEADFERMESDGAFCFSWRAHGLCYGIPDTVRQRVARGEALLVNLSRDVLAEVVPVFPGLTILNVTASPETLAARLAARGRESAAEIARRLDRVTQPLPPGLAVLSVSNDGALKDAAQRALALLQPESA